jgi:serine/threonine-protein kinase HipA
VTTVAEVRLWGRAIGAVSVDAPDGVAAFEYEPAFRRSGIELAPLMMPLAGRPDGGTVWRFDGLPRATFHGLPGMLADALPDAFGNAVIDRWLATQGRLPGEIDAVERLCYTGARGTGALEFRPTRGPHAEETTAVEIDALVALASDVLRARDGLAVSFDGAEREAALREILRVGASAGGARAKAVIAWNPTTNEVRSGQLASAPAGFEHWLLKFDGIANNRDRDLLDPLGYGVIEYAYALMARAAGIEMAECRLFEENGRRHFMTRRFDRPGGGQKLHLQSLAALAHFDLNAAGANSYEQALTVIRRLGLGMDAIEEFYRRMCFNVVARNQDDHVKNTAFLMDRSGTWTLSPAFDLTFSYNPDGAWTSRHQMSLAGKRDGFRLADFDAVERTAAMLRGRGRAILAEVTDAVARWPEFAAGAGVEEPRRSAIGDLLRLQFEA